MLGTQFNNFATKPQKKLAIYIRSKVSSKLELCLMKYVACAPMMVIRFFEGITVTDKKMLIILLCIVVT